MVLNELSMSSSHRQQFSTNCCKWVTLHMGCSPSGTACFSVGPPKGHKSYQEACSSIASSCLQVSARSPFQHRPPMDSSHPPASAWVSFMGCRGTTASPWAAPQAAGESWLWRLGTSCPSASTDLGVRVVPLTCSHPAFLCLQLPLL